MTRTEDADPMRAAAIVSGSIVSAGIFLVIAASLVFSPTWIGLGILAIALIGAMAIIGADGRSAEPGALMRTRES